MCGNDIGSVASPYLIAIAGGTGSGKTTLVKSLQRVCPKIAVLDQDSYYIDCSSLTADQVRHKNFDHPSAIDHNLLLCHVQQLLLGQAVSKPQYCFVSHRRGSTSLILPGTVVVVEGIFALWDPRIRDLCNLKLYVESDADLRVTRRLQRDTRERGFTVESFIWQYVNSVRPMHQEFIEPTRVFADIVVNGCGPLSESLNRIYEASRGKIAATESVGECYS
jgi:uridine kinase